MSITILQRTVTYHIPENAKLQSTWGKLIEQQPKVGEEYKERLDKIKEQKDTLSLGDILRTRRDLITESRSNDTQERD